MRRSDREVKKFEDIVAIMEKCDVCRVCLHDDEYPYILPLNFGMTVQDGKIELYFHGAMKGTKYDLIEISQLLNSRSTDVDDIILNTAGALAGAVLFRFLSRFRMVRPVHCQNGWAAYAAIFFSFLCRFFLYDEMGLAKILYGF